MLNSILRYAMLIVVVIGLRHEVLAQPPVDRPPQPRDSEREETKPAPLKPPQLELTGVAISTKACSLTFKLWNHNNRAIGYLGYAPDSFSPPLPKGMLIHGMQFKSNGKWQKYPLGYCGTGLTFLKLAPMRHEEFSVSVVDDFAANWEAVKVGVTWSGVDDQDLATAFANSKMSFVAWSEEITRKEVDSLKRD